MWWVIPFGLMLGLGTIAAMSMAVDVLSDLPREIAWIATTLIAIFMLIIRPVLRAVGRWLRSSFVAPPSADQAPPRRLTGQAPRPEAVLNEMPPLIGSSSG